MASTPPGFPLNQDLLFVPGQEGHKPGKRAKKGKKSGKDPLGEDFPSEELKVGPTDARLAALKAFGQLASLWPPESSLKPISEAIMKGLNARSAWERQVAATGVSHWFRAVDDSSARSALTQQSQVAAIHKLATELMACGDPRRPHVGTTEGYAELARASQKLKLEVKAVLGAAKSAKVKVQVATQGKNPEEDPDAAAELAASLAPAGKTPILGEAKENLEKARLQLATSAGSLKSFQVNLGFRVLFWAFA